MNFLCRAIVLWCAYYATVISAFPGDQEPIPLNPFLNVAKVEDQVLEHSAAKPGDVGKPLLLTPLIEAGKLEEARNLSRVKPLLDGVDSYAGFLTVNKTTKSHFYFWFVPKSGLSTHDAQQNASVPLILWLPGSPAWSSLYGLFNQTGPFEVTEHGLRRREHAWTNNYHMLYIDSLVGTGFSFAETEAGYNSTEEQIGEHLYNALGQFYQLFSELKRQDLYLAGELYSGKFISAIGYTIHLMPEKDIPLKGMMIGSGYTDTESMLEYAQQLYGLGMIDEKVRRKLENTQEKIKYLIRSDKWQLAFDEYLKLFHDLIPAIGSTSLQDYTRDNFRMSFTFEKFITQDRMRKLIHVGRVPYVVISKNNMSLRFIENFFRSVRPFIEELLEHYSMLFYGGQFDIMTAHSMTAGFLDSLRWSGAADYSFSGKKIWQEGNKVAGYYQCAGNLIDVLVRNAGQMVSNDQPENTLSMIDKFVQKEFQCDSSATAE